MGREDTRGQGTSRLSSPEQLNDYLRVTNPKIWVLLIAVVLLFAGFMLWSSVTSFESYVPAHVTAEKGELTVVPDSIPTGSIETGMKLEIGDVETEILAVGVDENGKVTASAKADIPDGSYSARIEYKTTQLISMLMN